MSPTITGRRSDRRPRRRVVAEPQLASTVTAGSRNFRPVPCLKRPPAHTTISLAVRLPLRASAPVYPLRLRLTNVTASVTQ